MHVVFGLIVQHALSNIEYKYDYLQTNLSTPQKNTTCSGDGLTYFIFKQTIAPDKLTLLNEACDPKETLEQETPPILNSSLQFFRQKITNTIEDIQAMITLSVDEALQRRVTLPQNHADCEDGTNIQCMPGPCRIWEYDYQARNTLGKDLSNSKYTTVDLVGKPVCGPVFGIQAASFAGLSPATVPAVVDAQTTKMFPSLQSTGAPDLTDTIEYRVPIVPNSSINLNPVYYYNTPAAHSIGSTKAEDYAPLKCSEKSSPYLVPTLATRWGTTGGSQQSAVRHLGLFDLHVALSASNMTSIAQAQGDVDNDYPYVNTIPQLKQGSLSTPNKTQTDVQSVYKDTCDLSQCSWLPYIDNDSAEDTASLETCYLAEIYALYRNYTNWYCDDLDSNDPNICYGRSADARSNASNPENYLPNYCFAPIDTDINFQTPNFTTVDCQKYPFMKNETATIADCTPPNLLVKPDVANCATSEDDLRNSGIPVRYTYEKVQQINVTWYHRQQKNSVDVCAEKTYNFKNMSDVYFRWPLNALFNSKGTDPKQYFWRNSAEGFYTKVKQNTKAEKEKVVTIPFQETPRYLPKFKCGPRYDPGKPNDFFYNVDHPQNKLLKKNFLKREFGFCFSNWNIEKYPSLIACLMDHGLAMSAKNTDNKALTQLYETSPSAQMQILSLLTYLFGRNDVNDNFNDDTTEELLLYGAHGLFDDSILYAFLEKHNISQRYAFDYFDSTTDFDENNLQQSYKPIPQAILDERTYKAKSPMSLNASFLNNAKFSESHACNCGNSPTMYAFEGIPLEYQPPIFRRGSIFNKNKGDATNTWLMHVGYSWLVNTMPDELSIGLYMQGNPSYVKNFTIVERDFLAPSTTLSFPDNTTEFLANRYYLGPIAPKPEALINELQFADVNTQSRADSTFDIINSHYNVTRTYNGAGQKFEVHETHFQYGSCVRFPYGQLSMMELSSDAQTYFYGLSEQVNDSNRPAVLQHHVGIESLMGYCENVANDESQTPKYAYCFGDPYHNHRAEFCSNPAAQYNVVGRAVNERQIDNVCNQEEKYCFYIPGDPLYPTLNDILINNQITDMSGYTILVSPFNFTVARFLLGPETYYYKVGGGGNVGNQSSSILIPNSTFVEQIYGIELLSQDEFNVLTGNWSTPTLGLDTAIQLITNITKKINNTKTGEIYKWPALQVNSGTANDAFVYPELTETNTKVAHPHLTILSAVTGGIIRYKQDSIDHASPITCNRFLVSSPGFILKNTFVNQKSCSKTQEIDTAVVLFGGSDVSNSQLTLGSELAITPVVFAGDDSLMFQKLVGANVNASNVTINYTNTDFTYALAAARTYTEKKQNITLIFPDNTPIVKIIVQPISSASNYPESIIGINAVVKIDIINISKYTAVFSNAVLQAEFPLRNVSQHVDYILFIGLVSSLAYFLLTVAVQVWHVLRETDIKETTENNFTITKQFGTTVAVNRHTNEHWNAHDLRSRVVATKLGNMDTGAPEELQTYLFNSHFKNE